MSKIYPTGNLRPPKARIQTTTDVVLFTMSNNQLQVVLIERKAKPNAGSIALPGGFMWQGETSSQTAQRVLATKAGVEDVYMEQLYTFDDPDRDSRGRVVSIAYMALVPADKLAFNLGPQTETPGLYPTQGHPHLSFDHDKILAYGLTRLASKLAYTNIAYALLPDSFTLTELQHLYELVMGRNLDKRNFRKKYLSLGLIEPIEAMSTTGRHRPAQLYRFVKAAPVELSEPAI